MLTTTEQIHKPETTFLHERFGHERLTPDQLRKAAAEIAILLILMAKYEAAKSKHGIDLPDIAEPGMRDGAILFGLLANAMRPGAQRTPIEPVKWGEYFKPFSFSTEPSTHAGKPNNGGVPPAQTQTDFLPAPSMGDVVEGPHLPNLPAGSRVEAINISASPTKADYVAAHRANNMYQGELWKSGWRGGDTTKEQEIKAARGMARSGHPDLGASAEDAEAYKAFNASHARPTTPGQTGEGPPNPAS